MENLISLIIYLIGIIFLIGFGVIMTLGLWKIINQDMLGNKPVSKNEDYIDYEDLN